MLFQFGIFAGGLEALLGEEVESGKEDEEATAGMSLDLLGVSLRPITFFTGQAGLLAAVWKAPAELTSALQVGLCTRPRGGKYNFTGLSCLLWSSL